MKRQTSACIHVLQRVATRRVRNLLLLASSPTVFRNEKTHEHVGEDANVSGENKNSQVPNTYGLHPRLLLFDRCAVSKHSLQGSGRIFRSRAAYFIQRKQPSRWWLDMSRKTVSAQRRPQVRRAFLLVASGATQGLTTHKRKQEPRRGEIHFCHWLQNRY